MEKQNANGDTLQAKKLEPKTFSPDLSSDISLSYPLSQKFKLLGNNLQCMSSYSTSTLILVDEIDIKCILDIHSLLVYSIFFEFIQEKMYDWLI